MNLGQIFETVLGWAGRELGEKFATPIFDGATLDDLNAWTDKAGIPATARHSSTTAAQASALTSPLPWA